MSGEPPLALAHDFSGRRASVGESLNEWGLDALLVTTPANLRYLLGYAGETPLGPNPFTGGISAALLVAASSSVCILPASDVAGLAGGAMGGLELATYETFLDLAPLFPRRTFSDLLVHVVGQIGGTRLGFEGASLPDTARRAIEHSYPRVGMTDQDQRVSMLRMRKTASELNAIRQAVNLCDTAQRAIVEAAKPGVTELELLDIARGEMQRLSEVELPLIHTVASGPESTIAGESASLRSLVAGDLLLTDIAPQLNGYWGDSCASGFVAGARDDERRRVVAVVKDALMRGTEAVRPGVLARDVDASMRDRIRESFPASPSYHHAGGHGIGLDYHEPPRLVPTEGLALQEGMVIALEPAVYLQGTGGIRLEHVVLVTADGCEVLSGHTPAW